MDSKALRPDAFITSMPSFIKDKEAEKKGASTEEIQLANLADTAGWKILKEFIEKVEKDLDEKNLMAMSEGKGLEEIGLNTVVINLTKGVIKKIVDKVNDAHDACEK